MDKTKAFIELYQLLLFYSENRDQPVSGGFNFFEELKMYCEILELDYTLVEKEFQLDSFKG